MDLGFASSSVPTVVCLASFDSILIAPQYEESFKDTNSRPGGCIKKSLKSMIQSKTAIFSVSYP